MSLSTKIFAIITTAVVIFLGFLYLSSKYILLSSFEKIESERMRVNLGRSENAYQDSIKDINVAISDWAMWDDTYSFVETLDSEYIESNISDNALDNLNINYMFFYDLSGKLVYSTFAGLPQDLDHVSLETISVALTEFPRLLDPPDPDTKMSGLIITKDKVPLIIAAYPIVKSDQSGPVKGTLIFAKIFGSSAMTALSEQVHLSLNFVSTETTEDEYRAVRSALHDSDSYVRTEVDSIFAYKYLYDIEKNPKLLMRVEMPRDIYNQGLSTVNYFILSTVILGAIFALIASGFLSVTILRPLKNLTSATLKIAQGHYAQSINSNSRDEIGALARNFNAMAKELQATFTELQKTQAQEMAKAKELLKLKDEFVFIAAHELRAPVTVIAGVADLMSENLKKMPAVLREPYALIVQASERLKQLVNDLLQTSRSESGTLTVTTKKIALHPLILNILKEHAGEMKVRKLKLTTELPDSVKFIAADESKLTEVLRNLITNAIKYNSEGGKIKVSTEPDYNMIKVTVSDTGVGIPEAQQNKIFSKFFRAHQAGTEDVEGTGLGLFIFRMLVRKMGGKVGFASKEGEGSRFWFTLPEA